MFELLVIYLPVLANRKRSDRKHGGYAWRAAHSQIESNQTLENVDALNLFIEEIARDYRSERIMHWSILFKWWIYARDHPYIMFLLLLLRHPVLKWWNKIIFVYYPLIDLQNIQVAIFLNSFHQENICSLSFQFSLLIFNLNNNF